MWILNKCMQLRVKTKTKQNIKYMQNGFLD